MKTIRLAALLLGSAASIGTARAETKPPAPVGGSQPDLDKPITTTLRKIERMLAAAQAQAQAQCVAQGAQADMQDLIKQATPDTKK